MDIYLAQWFTLIVVFTLAVLSPGPDFVVAVRNSLLYSRKVGIVTAFGFGAGISLHVTYTILGLAALIEQSVVVFNFFKWSGAIYLIYIGFLAIRSKGSASKITKEMEQESHVNLQMAHEQIKPTTWRVFRMGFLTNALNPKASLFFLAIFSQIISTETPLFWKLAYGLTSVGIVVLWFSLVAILLTYPPIRNSFLQLSHWIDRICGGLMISLGIKIILTPK